MSASDSGVVTPEAVVLAFETAGVGSRVVAALIDLGVQLLAFLAAVTAAAVVGSTPFGYAGVFAALFLIAFGYPVASETLWRGRTVGKLVMGLRVVTVEGGPERFRHATVRAALGLIDLWLASGAVAILAVLLTRQNQRLGDLAAGTIVVRERTGARRPAPATFVVPPGWEAYARTLDVSGLSESDYQAVRSFLLRAATLDGWTRQRLAGEIATPLLTRLRHQPPAGVQPEGLLVCVAALYQQRQRRMTTWNLPGEPAQQGVVASAPPGGQPAPEKVVPDSGGFVAPG
jgi:uncharacterized RDD family membrane protein YckC